MTDVMDAVRRHDDAFDAHDLRARVASETEDIEYVMPGGMTVRGQEQAGQFVSVFWEAIPDAKIESTNYVASGDIVAVEGTMTGTHRGIFRSPQGEIPPSGNPINLPYASFKVIRDGRVASEHLYFDQLTFLRQLGAME